MSRAARLVAHGFELDPFQVRAIEAIDAGRSVLVAAPTGAGKTVVAEYAVAKALDEGGKAFYTTPIKALSNQKFTDLVARHGPDRVGLLTGDNAINGNAPVVVMTTEVLRNMIYEASPTLDGLRYVILDEVHYLQDAYRGPVWEEVIIHSPPTADLVCLSATVSNAEELADWIGTVRGPTEIVIEETRPVELFNLYLVGDRSSDRLHLLPTLVEGHPNPEASRLDAESLRSPRPGVRSRRRLYTPRRAEVVDRLDEDGMLPVIYFIFSRAACDDAARACLDAGLRLTTPTERDRIREIVDERLAPLHDVDLDVLGYGRWMAALEAGIAAHHAGMVPPFKEAVEACFAQGLVKVVFATETLALGINMPARSVVIEKLSKFTGERHEFLTPGEYTQLTGRAGRRGIDEVGYAVVLWSPFVPFDQVAGLASSRTYALASAFRPTYNMAANLVRRYPADTAHHLLNLSFAQYQADRDVVRLETRLERRRSVVARLEEEARCERGDVLEYQELRARAGARRRGRRATSADVDAALQRLRPGDVILVQGGKSAGRAVVLSVASRKAGATRLRALTLTRRKLSLSASDFDGPPRPVAHVELPTPYAPNNNVFQRAAVRALQQVRLGAESIGDANPPASVGDDDGEERDVQRAAAAHPVAACPDAAQHLRALRDLDRARRDIEHLESSIRGRTESLARRFDRVLRILEAWGYLDGWTLTEAGERLARIYHECDLLIGEAVGAGLLDDLDPAALAGLVSCFTYEHRSAAPAPPRLVPVTACPRPGAGDRAARQGAQPRRGGGGPPADPTARPDVPGPGARVGRGRGPRPDPRRRGPLRRRLRPQRQAADRPPPPARRRDPARHRGRGPRGRRTALPRGGGGVVDRRGRGVTIEKGRAWGAPGTLPADGVVVRTDAEARAVVERARRAGAAPPALGLLGGDLCRTLGGRGDEARLFSGEAMVFPADLGAALVDGRLHWFVAHAVAMRSWWRGRVVMAMNAQWLGGWNAAPRAHPDDGLIDVLDLRLSPADRWRARRRLPTGTHVPHPGISVRRRSAVQLSFDPALPVSLDGEGVGRARHLSIRVEPDALTLVV